MDIKVFDEAFNDFLEEVRATTEDPEVYEWFKEVLVYNVPYGKKVRGFGIVKCFESLVTPEKSTPENIRLAKLLGWCMETFQALFLISDDIMDQSFVRRGKPCWYKQEHVTSGAILDTLVVETCVYSVIRKNFKHKDYYLPLLELFAEATKQSIVGQLLDSFSSMMHGYKDILNFSFPLLKAIGKIKTGYYTTYMPFVAGMFLAECYDQKIADRVLPVGLLMGYLYQIQDDFFDCYSDPNFTGKVGTDIEEGKCTWPIVVALSLASEAQKKIILDNFGKPDKINRDRVERVYDELELPKLFKIEEVKVYDDIMNKIKELSRELNMDGLVYLLHSIYHRQK